MTIDDSRPEQPAPGHGRLLGQDYWLVTSTPHESTTAEQIGAVASDHVAWLLELEAGHHVFLSGPLVEGPDARPGAGITVLRANDAAQAESLASNDPFVRAGLRSFTVHRWRLNEGSVSLRVSLGEGTFHWG